MRFGDRMPRLVGRVVGGKEHDPRKTERLPYFDRHAQVAVVERVERSSEQGRRCPEGDQLAPDLSVTEGDELHRGELGKPHRAEGVDLGGADPDFRAETQLESVVEAG